MVHMSLSTVGFERKRTRKRELLDEINLVAPWAESVGLIAPHVPARGAKGARPPIAVETMLRIQFLQHWLNLSYPAKEEALYDTPMSREYARLNVGEDHLTYESTILRFRHLLEAHNLSLQSLVTVNAPLTAKGLRHKKGKVVDATLIATPSSTKNSTGTRAPEIHQPKKRNHWHQGVKAHIDTDADQGMVHSVATAAANPHDITQARAMLHGVETDVFADSGYRGVEKREEIQNQDPSVNWHITIIPGKRTAMEKATPMGTILEKLSQTKAQFRATVEHQFRVIKPQFGYAKENYSGLAKNTANPSTLFVPCNL